MRRRRPTSWRCSRPDQEAVKVRLFRHVPDAALYLDEGGRDVRTVEPHSRPRLAQPGQDETS